MSSLVNEQEETKYSIPYEASSAEMIEGKLAAMKRRLPGHVIRELGETLKTMPVSEKQCDAIINRAVAEFERNDGGGMKEINQRITGIENSISKLAGLFTKSQPLNASSKTSDITAGRKPENETLENKHKPIVMNMDTHSGNGGHIQEDVFKALQGEMRSKPERQSSRLSEINEDIKSTMILLKWLEFLMEKVGRENLLHTLEFYVDIGWLNDYVLSQMMTYARGINIPQYDSNGVYTYELMAKDHIQSLLFIERLRGTELDRNMISMLEREVSNIKKGSEEIYGI